MVDPQCGESAIVSMPIVDPRDIRAPSRRRQLEWYWGLRHGQIDLADKTVRVRQDMASRRRSKDPWAILPEPDMLQIMLECVDYNFRTLSTTKRSSIDYTQALSYHDYVFCAPASKPRIYCTYDDGTCKAFDHPYTDFPPVRSYISPWFVTLGMLQSLCCHRSLRTFDQFLLVSRILDQSGKRFPMRFYWGPIRRSLQHPGSVADSFCAAESDAESVVRWPPDNRRSGSDDAASSDAPSPLEVSRILDWRADISKCDIEALPIPDILSHSLGRARRPGVFKLSSDIVGYTGWHEPSRFSSNDWAYHKLGVSLWLPDGGRSESTDEEQRTSLSRRMERDATVTTEVAVAGSVISCPRSELPEIDCATAYSPPASPRMEGEPVPSRSPSPCPRTVFHAEDIDRDALAEKENMPVCLARGSACGTRKRRRDVDILHFSCPRKRTKCH
ncbi:hypothetical protein FISHEDRAFT_75193 [Fistulina hepatica ATCC 64428]|uniref:Uncharacterized protein n=1 Tax=Fistulina hepatica ATCC 64428 TaxID=1128425 RepID=A0A0D7A879_9AGAR|nr:hypothetical protein FISHEDRAFT_75193 [Fistulina hepatica ATCC 64428]